MTETKIHTLDLGFMGHTETIAAFVIERAEQYVLIETGPYSTLPVLLKVLKRQGVNPDAIQHVLLTHIHFDHAGAAWYWAERGANIYVHPAGVKHLIDPTKLYNSAKRIYQDQMEVLWGMMKGIHPEQLISPEHGEIIQLNNIEVTAWYTPGHAVHHIAWQFEDALFTGDIAGCKIGNGIVVPPCPPPDINIEQWRESIDLMRSINANKFYLTHFGLVTDTVNHLTELEKRLLEWAEWMRIRFEDNDALSDITPQFQDYVAEELARNGIVGKHQRQYESANPTWMSVAGLMRYWQKKKAHSTN